MLSILDIGHTRIKGLKLKNKESKIENADFFNCPSSGISQIYGHINGTVVFYASVFKEAESKLISLFPGARRVSPRDIPMETEYNREHIGVDRLLCSFAALLKYPGKAICIIDAGSFLTIDIVKNNVHKGGYILPSYEKILTPSVDAMDLKLTGLVDIKCLPRDTEDAVKNAAFLAIAQFIKYIAEENNLSLLILTGGFFEDKAMRSLFGEAVGKTIEFVYEPNLLFLGMLGVIKRM